MSEKQKTAEEILDEKARNNHIQCYQNYDEFMYWRDGMPKELVLEAMEQYARQLTAPLEQRIANMQEVFKWVLGYYDFPEPPETGRPRYYWRSHLQEKLKEIGVDINGTQSPFQPRETDQPLPTPPAERNGK